MLLTVLKVLVHQPYGECVTKSVLPVQLVVHLVSSIEGSSISKGIISHRCSKNTRI